MHAPWHRRIHWARLGVVGAIALAAWSLDAQASLQQELTRLRADCSCAQPEAGPPAAAVTGRFVQVTDDVLRELGVELEPALQVSARRLKLDDSAWYGLFAGPQAVDWSLTVLPDELGPAACASLPDGQPVTLDLVERSVIVDYELSSPGGVQAVIPRPAATRVHVTAQRVGRRLELEVVLESRPVSEALQLELGSISSAAIDVSFTQSPLGPRQFSLSLEPGQTVLLPGPAEGEVVAFGVGIAPGEDR